jgi:hypothetical protein
VKTTGIVRALAVLCMSIIWAGATHGAEYAFTDLSVNLVPRGINNQRTIAGDGFVWPDGAAALTNLGGMNHVINNRNEIAGYDSGGGRVWDKNGHVIGSAGNRVLALNDNGQYLSYTDVYSTRWYTLYSVDGGGSVDFDASWTVTAINNAGQVSYYRSESVDEDTSVEYACVSYPNGTSSVLASAVSRRDQAYHCYVPLDINDNGQAAIAEDYTRNVDGQWVTSHSLSGFGQAIQTTQSVLTARLNDHGQCLYGIGNGFWDIEWYFYSGGVSRSLSALLPAGWAVDSMSSVDPSRSGDYAYAFDLNDNGDIVGTARYDGQLHGFLLAAEPAPVPEPSSLLVLLGGIGSISGMLLRRKR